MGSISCGAGVYVDALCRLHASRAEIEIGEGSRIMRGAYLCSYVSNAISGEGIRIGRQCWIGVGAIVASGRGGLYLGDNVLVGPGAILVTGGHDYRETGLSAIEQRYQGRPIRVGNNVWIGAGAVILGGSVIGERSVIAAGAVVSGEISPYSVAGGVPAKVIRKLSRSEAR